MSFNVRQQTRLVNDSSSSNFLRRCSRFVELICPEIIRAVAAPGRRQSDVRCAAISGKPYISIRRKRGILSAASHSHFESVHAREFIYSPVFQRYAVSVISAIRPSHYSPQMSALIEGESRMPSRTATLAVEDSEKKLQKTEVTEGEPTPSGPDYPEGGLQGWATVVGACVVRLWRVSGDLADTLSFQVLHPDMRLWVCRNHR